VIHPSFQVGLPKGPDHRPRRNARAFTLIELVLSMAIAALLAASLHEAMATAWRAKRTSEAAIDQASAGTIAMDLICRDLAATPPLPSSEAIATKLGGPFEGVHQAAGGGDNDDLLFHTLVREEGAADDDPLADGMHIIEYLIRQDQTGPVLVRRVTRNILSPVDQVSVDEVLCRNVTGLSFRYYDGTDWQTDWDSTALGDVLPLAVQVTIDMPDPQHANANPPAVREISRVVPLACAKAISTSSSP